VDVAAGYLNAYRARIADLVLVTMAEPGAPHLELADAMRAHVRPEIPVLRAVLRPRPLEPVAGERVAFFCTAPPTAHAPLARHLEETHGARVTHVSGSLADRARLRDDLAQTDADVFVVELKAAAVDVVVEEARRRGVRVVLAANDVLPIAGERSLDVELERLAAEAIVHAPQAVR
jgi:cyclic 2,3-diphosphoglycerate synthetase